MMVDLRNRISVILRQLEGDNERLSAMEPIYGLKHFHQFAIKDYSVNFSKTTVPTFLKFHMANDQIAWLQTDKYLPG